jgi:hypothetical protein
MTADFFTKPLQGAAFYKFCDLILNYKAPQPQECVGNKNEPKENIGRRASTTTISPERVIANVGDNNKSTKTK